MAKPNAKPVISHLVVGFQLTFSHLVPSTAVFQKTRLPFLHHGVSANKIALSCRSLIFIFCAIYSDHDADFKNFPSFLTLFPPNFFTRPPKFFYPPKYFCFAVASRVKFSPGANYPYVVCHISPQRELKQLVFQHNPPAHRIFFSLHTPAPCATK